MKKRINETNLFILQGNPLQEKTDILTNWTVPRLNGGDKLFFRIHEEGGSSIYKDCQRTLTRIADRDEISKKESIVPVGEVVVTTAGILPCKFIIHAVIPDYRSEQPAAEHLSLLGNAIQKTFVVITEYMAAKERITKVTFTPIPAYIYGSEHTTEAVQALISSLIKFAERSNLRTIRLICETPEDYKLYSTEFYNQTTTGFKRFLDRFLKLEV